MPFPEEITVTLTIKMRVADQEERDYWLNPATIDIVSADCIADMYDNLKESGNEVISINDLTQDQIRAALQARI